MMPVRRNQNWLPSIFNDFFDNDWMVKANATAPAINVFETAKEYKVELAAPGMTKEDFNVHIDEENNLVISMEKKTESKEENNKDEKKEGRYLRNEFCCDGQLSGDYLVYGLFQLLYFFFRGAGGKTIVQLALLSFYVC